MEHKINCICSDCQARRFRYQRMVDWTDTVSLYTKNPHQTLQEQFSIATPLMREDLKDFFDQYVYDSSVDYFRNWISNLDNPGERRQPLLYEELLVIFRQALHYLISRHEAQRVIREGLNISLLRLNYNFMETLYLSPRIHRSALGSVYCDSHSDCTEFSNGSDIEGFNFWKDNTSNKCNIYTRGSSMRRYFI